jgi:glycosyltransferase involved in cell wall biosynthesis
MPSVGLAMIVKNGAKTLRECIQSVAGVADQIVIADTGSTDETTQLARELGAEVFDFPWQDDFAQARNAAARALTTDWVLVLDDDEELDPQARDQIPPLLNDSGMGAYSAIQRNYIPFKFVFGGYASFVKPIGSAIPRVERAQSYADLKSVRLFRHHPGIYYVGRVHELVDARVAAVGLEIGFTDFVVHHFGNLRSAEGCHRKDELYRRLGWLKVKDVPNDPQAWVELGLQEFEQFKNYSVAVECFRKAFALNISSTIAYLSLATLYVEIHDDVRALELLSTVPMKGRAEGEKEQVCGDALYNLGRLKEARAAYLRALRTLPEDARVGSKLGLTEVRLGLKKNGLARLAKALKDAPVFEMEDRQMKAYIVANMRPQAAEAAERMAHAWPTPTTILRAASVRAEMREWGTVQGIVVEGLRLFPDDQELLQAKAELDQGKTGPKVFSSGKGGSQQNDQRTTDRSATDHSTTDQCTTGLSEETALSSRP